MEIKKILEGKGKINIAHAIRWLWSQLIAMMTKSLDRILILLTLIVTTAGFLIALDERNQAEIPFFQYRYDLTTKTVNISSKDTFNIESMAWFAPSPTGTSTGALSDGNVAENDIISNVMDNLLFSGKFPSQFDPTNVQGYIRCSLMNQYTNDSLSTSTQPLNGFPVLVKILYDYKGKVREPREDLAIFWLNNTSLQTPIVSSHDGLSQAEWDAYLKSADEEMVRVLKRISYEPGTKYLDDKGNCNQMGWPVPTVHVNLDS